MADTGQVEFRDKRDEILADQNSIVKFYKYEKFRDQYTSYRPVENEQCVIAEDFDNQYIKVLFKAGSKAAVFNAWVKQQKPELQVTEVSKEDFVEFYKTSISCQSAKNSLRLQIRSDKDLEDDLTDQKIVIQNLLFFICDLWVNILTPEQKAKSKYNSVMSPLATLVLSDEVQLRANLAEPTVFQKIMQDEQKYAEMAKVYLDKKSGENI